ncbi:hypothetical protein SCLCIDRAFT_269752 [Scleroderma citrinum Foug A]|uniref:Uncharacterized protein n=1 Tax=Scleroderma citrinum Foug A TaxID=1036808 RepID=A0A0C3DIT7_9AGAM|nr:hypothetical protein SCLCIDRAFT_269752 [Scleroderma citrinum Foug A]
MSCSLWAAIFPANIAAQNEHDSISVVPWVPPRCVHCRAGMMSSRFNALSLCRMLAALHSIPVPVVFTGTTRSGCQKERKTP